MDCGGCALFVLIVIIIVIAIQLIRLFFADADLTLLWKEKHGFTPDLLAERVVWITGASSGIGEHLAYQLARRRCKLILSARREEELERVKKQCLVSGKIKEEDVMVLPLDVLAFDTHEAAAKTVLDRFKTIDILVNNAGRSQRAWAAETELEVQRQIVELNLLGPISLTKAVLPHFIEKKAGHIVVTSSIAGKLGAPFSAGYCASKFALHGWFDTLRLEMTPNNISVTLVCPGPVFSSIISSAFTGDAKKMYGVAQKSTEKRMPTERCAELMVTSIVNKLDEVWISYNPILFFTYLTQYFPDTARWLAKRMGVKNAMKAREGKL